MTKSITLIKRLDFGLFAVLALCLFTLWPLLYRPGLPNGTDTLYHIYRAAEMDRSWSHGVLLPGWAETFYFGYGSPLFSYYASLTYYITSIVIRLTGFDVVNSLRLLITLSMLGAGAGMYLFMRDQVRKLAGIIAALCYVYSPYIVYTEPYARGVYPELLSFVLFPFIMWSYGRLMRTGRPGWMILAALTSMALIITHNLMGLVLTGLLMAWIVWNLLVSVRSKDDLRNPILALVTAFLGVGLAAYFWLPVILEVDAAPLDNLTGIALLDYRNFFVPLDTLLAFTPRSDASAINGLLHQINLGVAQWGLALAGVFIPVIGAVWWTKDRRLPHTLIFFTLMAAAMIFLMLPAAEGLWARATPLAFLQFPWRLLGPAAFCLAVLAGMNALWIQRLPARIGGLITAVMVILPIALAMPMFYVPEWTNQSVDTSVSAYHRAELSGLQLATTYSNEYLPVGVKVMPDPTARLIADYADGYPVNKAHLEALPPDVRLDMLEHTPQSDTWRVESDQPFTMEVLTFYFPGWQAEIDGISQEVRPSDPHGLITLDVPAGDHEVRVYMGQTPAGSLGIGVTAVSIILLVGLGLYIRRRPTQFAAKPAPLQPAYRVGVVAGGIVQLVLVLALMREGAMWVNSPPGEALLAQHPVVYNLGDQIQLISYDISGERFSPGDRLELKLYWYAREPVDFGYASFVHVSTGGPPLAQEDKANPAGRPTLEWSTDGHYDDPYVITLPENMPPGQYQVFVGLYTCDTRPAGECGNGDRPPVTDAEGRSFGDAVLLASITVR